MTGKDKNDFSPSARKRVLERAAHRCSFPGCPVQLSGASLDPDSTVFIGEVAHIRGARPAANNRYSSLMTPEQRSHHSNAIALCRNHAKLIDSDEDQYTVEMISSWKEQHEHNTRSHRLPEPNPYPYEKPFEQCSSDEFRQEIQRMQAMLKEERKEKGVALAPWIFGLLFTWLLFKFIVSLYGDSPLWLALIALGIIALLMKLILNMSKESDFEKHQKDTVKTIKIILKNRGERY